MKIRGMALDRAIDEYEMTKNQKNNGTRSFHTTLDALKVLSERWGSAYYLYQYGMGDISYDMADAAWETCSGGINSAATVAVFCSCTGGIIWIVDGEVFTENRLVELEEIDVYAEQVNDDFDPYIVGELLQNPGVCTYFMNTEVHKISISNDVDFGIGIIIDDDGEIIKIPIEKINESSARDKLMGIVLKGINPNSIICEVWHRALDLLMFVEEEDWTGDHELLVEFVIRPKKYIKNINLSQKSNRYNVCDLHAHNISSMICLCVKFSTNTLNMILSKFETDYNNVWNSIGRYTEQRVKLYWKSTDSVYRSLLYLIPREITIDGIAPSLVVEKYSKYISDESLLESYGLVEEIDEFLSYWNNRTTPITESIPFVSANIDGYSMFRLERDDIRGPILGLITNCCQHPWGMGRSCAYHGTENPDGCFYVVTNKKGEIIAQSWTWKNCETGTLCFDNIEALDGGYSDIIRSLYMSVSLKLIGRLGITKIIVGTGYSKVDVSNFPKTERDPKYDSLVYSDADDCRVIIKGGK